MTTTDDPYEVTFFTIDEAAKLLRVHRRTLDESAIQVANVICAPRSGSSSTPPRAPADRCGSRVTFRPAIDDAARRQVYWRALVSLRLATLARPQGRPSRRGMMG